MDRKEFATWAMALKTYFPRENLLPNQQAVELWYQELQDIQYITAEAALRKWVQTQKWSPTISEIRETATSIAYTDIPDWGEAWGAVLKAISDYGYYQANEGMDSLDKLTQRCVQQLGGFAQLCWSENGMADRANFRLMYESMAKREQTNQQIAPALRQNIDNMRLDPALNRLLEGGTSR